MTYVSSQSVSTAARRDHALVIGGSMAGLAAARVLLDHFDEVTVVDGDHFPSIPGPRSAVPQAKHAHVLLLRSLEILERLFPGFSDSVASGGGQMLDMAGDAAWLTPAGWGRRFPSDLVMLAASRDLMEWHARGLLATHPRIRFREATLVAGLLHEAGRVNGILAVDRDRGFREVSVIADLVVDASGRGSRLPSWLEEIGFEAPAETVVDSSLGYATRVCESRWSGRDWKLAYVQLAPPEFTRGGLILPIENGRCLVTLIGVGGDYPPMTDAGYLEFARTLRSPIIYDFLKSARAVSGIASNRHSQNRLRHYEKLRRFPKGLLALGDAVCAFNPVYGQGMTTAALHAIELQRCLTRQTDLSNIGHHFQAQLARINVAPWMLATSEDYRVRGVIGGRPDFRTRLMHFYMDRVTRLTTHSIPVRRVFLEVMHMLKSPDKLFAPGILAQVLMQAVAGAKPATSRFDQAITKQTPQLDRAAS